MFFTKIVAGLIIIILSTVLSAQDLSEGLMVNDLSLHPMQDIDKPAYLESIVDPSFNTTIRRITNAAPGGVIVPMYSTIQAWNADETMMILYNQSEGNHSLLNGINYQFIRSLDDVNPIDLEQIFWDFNDPKIFYYPDRMTNQFVRYSVDCQQKENLVDLALISNCNGSIEMGNDIQMMSWDSDVFTFRCSNESTYSYRISDGTLTTFSINDVDDTAPAVAPSGMLFYHTNEVYNEQGNSIAHLNKSSVEHSCIGKLTNGNDGYFAIAFAEGPDGGCIGDVISHDLTNGECFPLISQSQGYDYPQSGTHISALAHKNTNGGWLAASMIGYDQDGQALLDQELVIVKADQNDIRVCRIGHHRSDEDEYDYWGEPHAVISPSGTRVLFGSDWSGTEDGISVDSYVVELPSFSKTNALHNLKTKKITYKLYPNPVNNRLTIDIENPDNNVLTINIYDAIGQKITTRNCKTRVVLNTENYTSGIYFFDIQNDQDGHINGKFIKH